MELGSVQSTDYQMSDDLDFWSRSWRLVRFIFVLSL